MSVRVLLTRAAEDAARTRATLEALGHRVMVSPVIAVEGTGAEWPGAGVVDALLATSRQAFVAIVDGWGPTPEARRLMPLWLVGRRTEDAARARGFAGAAYVAPNAVALAFEMRKRRGQSRIIYLAGRDRKPDIETALSVTEQTIDLVEVYDAQRINNLETAVVTALVENRLDVVFHFSQRSATIFADLVVSAAIPMQALHVCLSDEVALPLNNRGWPIRIAAEPTEASMIRTLNGD